MTDTVRKNEREAAADVLYRVLEEGSFSHIELKEAFLKYRITDRKERAFITRVCMGTIERLYVLDSAINAVSRVKTEKMKPYIRTLLRMSTYQLLFLSQTPASAICNEAVKLAKKRGFTGLSGFVNGVLRSIAKDREQVFTVPENPGLRELGLYYSMPEWLLKLWIERFGTDTVGKMLAAFYQEKHVTVRCNESKIEIGTLKELLTEQGIGVEDGAYVKGALRLSKVTAIEELEAFQTGCFQIQDESSMLVCLAAGLKKGDKVIDLCAAPGGKSLHAADILKKLGGGDVQAADVSEAKAKLIRENIARSGFENITVMVRDARITDESCLESADVLLCDLPCSGLGVIGRKPEIKYRVTNKDLSELAALQREILTASAGYVKPGGTLIYSTCTISRQENEDTVEWLLNRGFEEDEIGPYLPEPLRKDAVRGSIQLLPGIHGTDGFFLARLTKKR